MQRNLSKLNTINQALKIKFQFRKSPVYSENKNFLPRRFFLDMFHCIEEQSRVQVVKKMCIQIKISFDEEGKNQRI